MSKFIGALLVKLVKDDHQGLWELQEPLSFQSDLVNATITAPAGFQTDFMSVPRLPIIYSLLGNRGRMSGAIHDWLYTSHEYDRETSDKILHEMLLINDFTPTEAKECYLAVRKFGEEHWS